MFSAFKWTPCLVYLVGVLGGVIDRDDNACLQHMNRIYSLSSIDMYQSVMNLVKSQTDDQNCWGVHRGDGHRNPRDHVEAEAPFAMSKIVQMAPRCTKRVSTTILTLENHQAALGGRCCSILRLLFASSGCVVSQADVILCTEFELPARLDTEAAVSVGAPTCASLT